jgi:hypothetical protein
LTDPAGDAVAGKFFPVSCNPTGMWNDPAAYGIYLLDVYGNRVFLHDDPETSCWQARPLEPRSLPPTLAESLTVDDPIHNESATVLVTDVYPGLDGVKRGALIRLVT